MDDKEIEVMAALEGHHWWYRGLRDMLESLLHMPRFTVPHGARVLDAGCGTGENLRLLQKLVRPSYCGGFDVSARAVARCREKNGPAVDAYVADIRCPTFHVDQLDLVVTCDVLSIAGLEASRKGLRSLVMNLRRGGVFIIHLPAFAWLRSAHDTAMSTCDRVNAPQLRRLMTDVGLRVEYMTYRVFWLFPAILMRRAPALLNHRVRQRACSDLAPVGAWLNELLFGSLRAENWMARHGARFPWGSSLLAVGRRDRAS